MKQSLSKAQMLLHLKDKIKKSTILPLFIVNIGEYKKNQKEIVKDILKKFNSNLIVRSSSKYEDLSRVSNAGKYETILNVKPDEKEIAKAINSVIASYKDTQEENELFIQPMLENVTLNGVAFSADINTLSPYFIINYDTSGKTNIVTNGSGKELNTFVAYRNNYYCEDRDLKKVIEALLECEGLLKCNYLDIEFAIANGTLYLLQVRELPVDKNFSYDEKKFEDGLKRVYKKIKKLNSQHPKILGKKAIFGVMPDWNPAEIIGVRPKKLALSLYKELITDDIWAYQRAKYGYRNLVGSPLIISFMGMPFVDVRVSFNSFIPDSLENDIAKKMVDYYLLKLSLNKTFHDKIEFEIVFSCYFFGIEKRLLELKKCGFNDDEIEKVKISLLQLTKDIVSNESIFQEDIELIEKLPGLFDNIVNSSLYIIDKIYWLIEDCKNYGTLPFAGIARAAFIGMQFLKSMTKESIITQTEYNRFLNSLNTISKQMQKDKKRLSRKEFLRKYGHLRPGTYDITSKRYDQMLDFDVKIDITEEEFSFSVATLRNIQKWLNNNQFNINADDFISFIKNSIEKREEAKFIFTKHVSQILEYIKDIGKKYSISEYDLAYLDINQIKSFYSSLENYNIKEIMLKSIDGNKKLYEFTKIIKLPSIIADEKDVYRFYMLKDEPNFITLKNVEAFVAKDEELKGKIVCLESADPGYDYIFAKQIAGLITCYGGANSHIAIRCAELGIPAVIGCGEEKFNLYKNAKKLKIDALNKKVTIL